MSSLVGQYIAGAIVLILAFLLLSNWQASEGIANAFGNLNIGIIGALQGRPVSTGGVSVGGVGGAGRRRE